jgi:hypothetical protein
MELEDRNKYLPPEVRLQRNETPIKAEFLKPIYNTKDDAEQPNKKVKLDLGSEEVGAQTTGNNNNNNDNKNDTIGISNEGEQATPTQGDRRNQNDNKQKGKEKSKYKPRYSKQAKRERIEQRKNQLFEGKGLCKIVVKGQPCPLGEKYVFLINDIIKISEVVLKINFVI